MKLAFYLAILAGTVFFTHSTVQKEDYAPYIAYLKSNFNPCVGVLIKASWVLAPSHCYLPNLRVMLGNFKSRVRDGTEQTIHPIQIIRYWNFSHTAPQDDLMLIRLAKPATFNHKVQVLPIATTNVRPGTVCTLSGLDWSQGNVGILKIIATEVQEEVAVATVICKGKLQGIEVGHFMGGDVGIYTNLYTYIPWIEKTIKEKLK